jgi:hypothetical protein
MTDFFIGTNPLTSINQDRRETEREGKKGRGREEW